MIEEDQLLQFAAETGFRLCCKEGWTNQHGLCEDWCRTFSATWDPNDPTKLFVCSQNGQLRIIDILYGTFKEYHVLFRQFSSATEGNGDDFGKVVQSHWDKIVLVPQRPGEIIFLLGISKNLMYTAVPGFPTPYPANPMIARTTRGDSPDFLYGTPILELASHSCRITALATSDDGHLSASGDEHGNIQLCVLVRQMARKMPLSLSELKNIRVMLKPHGGPIFSIQWLPVTVSIRSESISDMNGSKNVHYVATGSADRAVRLWKVVCCSEEGITASIYCIFDTTSTHVLSMHSCFISNQTRNDAVRENADTRQYSYRVNSKYPYNAEDTVYLAAGTNTGCVYIWKLILSELEAVTSNNAKMNCSVNDLHSLTQSTEYPIVQIAISLDVESIQETMVLDSAMCNLLVVTSDTCACIRSHSVIDMMENDNIENIDGQLSLTRKSAYSAMKGDNGRGHKTGKGTVMRPGPLGTVFDDAVLAFSLRSTGVYNDVLKLFTEPSTAIYSQTLLNSDMEQVTAMNIDYICFNNLHLLHLMTAAMFNIT